MFVQRVAPWGSQPQEDTEAQRCRHVVGMNEADMSARAELRAKETWTQQDQQLDQTLKRNVQ